MRATSKTTVFLTAMALVLPRFAAGQDATPLEAVTGGEVKCVGGKAKVFDCQDVDLVSFLPAADMGGNESLSLGNLSVIINDMWGWTDSTTGREFALVGRVDGTSFVDVTDPAKPKYLGQLPYHEAGSPGYWRDVKVYKNHAFIVADGSGEHGMQVFDLTQLRDVKNAPATFTETAHYDNIASAHNIVINESTGYAYAVGSNGGGETCGGALHMIDIREPTKPTFAGCYGEPKTGRAKTGYTHDAQCVTYNGPDTQYKGRDLCFNSSETALGIGDVTDKSAPKTISITAYPNAAYTHQGWLTDDQRFFFINDETDDGVGGIDRTRTIVVDVTDLDEPVIVKEWRGTTPATDHNLYISGQYMYQANYKAGLRVIDISDPKNPQEVAYFDTTPDNQNEAGYAGAWSNYPYFKTSKEGIVGVSSISEGLFMVRVRPKQASR